jgi:serine protease AprX
MATPMVSGAAALLLQKEPGLTPDQVKAHLMRTASKSFPESSVATDPSTGQTFTSDYDIFTVGAGYLDLQALLNDDQFAPADAEAVSPVAVYNEETQEVEIVTDSSVLWGRGVLWGRNALWGTSIIWGRAVIVEDNSVLWGRSILWGRSVLWGRADPDGFSILWGRESPYAESVLWGRDVEATNVLIHGEE